LKRRESWIGMRRVTPKGSSLFICIPAEVVERMEIEEGMFLEAGMEEIEGREDKEVRFVARRVAGSPPSRGVGVSL